MPPYLITVGLGAVLRAPLDIQDIAELRMMGNRLKSEISPSSSFHLLLAISSLSLFLLSFPEVWEWGKPFIWEMLAALREKLLLL